MDLGEGARSGGGLTVRFERAGLRQSCFTSWCRGGTARRSLWRWLVVTAHGLKESEVRAHTKSVHMGGAEDSVGAERPMRRSRMLSDDARLALQLQDEELKAARGMKRPKSALPTSDTDSPSSTKRAKQEAGASSKSTAKPSEARGSGGGRVAGQQERRTEPSAKNKGAARASVVSASRPKEVSRPERAGGTVRRESKAPKKSNVSSSPAVSSDTVSFTLEPWPSAQEDVPQLRRSSMTLQEDQTILSIKRKIVEEAYPGTDVSKVEIRTPTGIKCGQDHSLKYVRSFLWPVSKGDLVLYYCQAADSFL